MTSGSISGMTIAHMDNLLQNLEMPEEVKNRIRFVCNKCLKAGIMYRSGIESVNGAIVYYVCKSNKVPIDIDKLAELSKTTKNKIIAMVDGLKGTFLSFR
ncbi:MAG: cyclin family protein [Candidatus Micrarchaeota archaeon]